MHVCHYYDTLIIHYEHNVSDLTQTLYSLTSTGADLGADLGVVRVVRSNALN